jgi:flagellin
MPIVVNTNASATEASFNLSKANESLRKSLARLSSGKRISQPAEDAGGLAVAYKLQSKVNRTEAVIHNHENALSFLQVQDGALQTVGAVLDRMSELRTMAADITKNEGDIENYSKEFLELQSQLKQISREKFNGISLFSNQSTTGTGISSNSNVSFNSVNHTTNPVYTAHSREVLTHPSGVSADGNISINLVNLEFVLSVGTLTNGGSQAGVNLMGLSNTTGNGVNSTTGFVDNITHVTISMFTEAIERLADMRAENGAEQNRILQSVELHRTNMVNLEAAHGRIMDADVALESTRFARYNVLVQASAAMTAQANQLTNVALTLLQ